MLSRIKTLGLAALMAGLSTGCASIVSKSAWPLAIQSTPPGADITIHNKTGKEIYKGTTPAKVRLKSGAGFFKKASYSVSFTMAGYQARSVPVHFTMNGWYLGNLVFGGLIGFLIVDPATGAMWKIESEYMNEKLIETTASVTEPQLRILNLNDIPQEWRAHLEPVK